MASRQSKTPTQREQTIGAHAETDFVSRPTDGPASRCLVFDDCSSAFVGDAGYYLCVRSRPELRARDETSASFDRMKRSVMAGLVPANYATPVVGQMAGTSPAMTMLRRPEQLPIRLFRPRP